MNSYFLSFSNYYIVVIIIVYRRVVGSDLKEADSDLDEPIVIGGEDEAEVRGAGVERGTTSRISSLL